MANSQRHVPLARKQALTLPGPLTVYRGKGRSHLADMCRLQNNLAILLILQVGLCVFLTCTVYSNVSSQKKKSGTDVFGRDSSSLDRFHCISLLQ